MKNMTKAPQDKHKHIHITVNVLRAAITAKLTLSILFIFQMLDMMTSLRRHYPDQVHQVSVNGSQPGVTMKSHHAQ